MSTVPEVVQIACARGGYTVAVTIHTDGSVTVGNGLRFPTRAIATLAWTLVKGEENTGHMYEYAYQNSVGKWCCLYEGNERTFDSEKEFDAWATMILALESA